jgi:hypothetical protein
VIERERERLINLSRIFFYSNRTTHMREKKRNPKKRHLSLSLSALSIHALALFFFVLFTRANFCREARASRISLSFSLFEYILHIVYFVVDLEFNWPFFFQKSKRRKFFFKKFNNTFKQKRARIHITHRIHAQQRQQQQRRQVLYF